jgi:hypothetical protein
MATYKISYTCFDCFDTPIKSGIIKVKSADNKVHAKIKLEMFLKSKLHRCNYVVMDSCTEENDTFDFLKDIFGMK